MPIRHAREIEPGDVIRFAERDYIVRDVFNAGKHIRLDLDEGILRLPPFELVRVGG